MSPLVDLHRHKEARTADHDVEDDPDDHLGYLCLGEELQTELENEYEFTEADHDEDPALCPDSLTLGISHISVILSRGRSGDQTEQQDPEDTDGMLSRHGEDVLDEEGVELHHLPDQHELYDSNEPHVS